MKGIFSFVKTNFSKVPSMKVNEREDSDDYNMSRQNTGFKGSMEISDGVIAFRGAIVHEEEEEQPETLIQTSADEFDHAMDSIYSSEPTDYSNTLQEDLLELVTIEANSEFQINSDNRSDNDISISGVFGNTITNSSQDVMKKIDSVKEKIGLGDPASELVLVMENDTDNGKAYTYKQFYKNVEALGYIVKATMDYDANELSLESYTIPTEVLGKSIPTIEAKLSEKEANDWVRTLYPDATKIISSLIIYPEKGGKSPKLAYLSYLYNQNDRSRRQQIVTDANTGEIIYEDDMSF